MNFIFLIMLFSIFAISPLTSAQHPDTIGIWIFDEEAGDEAADSSGHEHTATVDGGKLEWVDGKNGVIDELQILSVALSTDEIQSDVNNGIQLPVEPTGKVTTTWGKLKTQW